MPNKIALILGCSGQDGSLLSHSLLTKGYKVIGVTRSNNTEFKNHKKLGIQKDIEIKKCDISNLLSISKIIKECNPDKIFNLAAQSSVGKSILNPIDTVQGIVSGTLNILEASRKNNFSGRIFFAGSSEIFGNTEIGADIKHIQNPINPYGIGKQASFNLVKFYRDIHNIKCVTGVLFNHESPLRNKDFVTQKIINGARLIKNGNKNVKLKLGNIKAIRDWGWAPEYIDAIQIITDAKKLNDHVICTGQGHSLEVFIEKVFSFYNLNWEEHVEIDKSLFRPNEIKKSFGDPEPLFKELNWKASSNLDTIVKKLINNVYT